MTNNILAFVRGETLERGLSQLKDAGIEWNAVRIIDKKEPGKYKLLIINVVVEEGIIKDLYFD